MGIDVQGFNYLNYCKQYGNFNDTITIGRQEIHTYIEKYSGFCEKLMVEYFGSTFVDSIDNSDYEGASIIWDFNKSITDEKLISKYDTVIDLGTLEHIYNINTALHNVSKLCKIGGQIIHVLPANNFCGHGFWQISPELFFSLYSEKNGYVDTEVFILDIDNLSNIQKLNKPTNGQRLTVETQNRIYVATRTVLKDDFLHDDVNQSDYIPLWDKK